MMIQRPTMYLALAALLLSCGDIKPGDETTDDTPEFGLAIDTVTPASGPIAGGTSITVSGSGFIAGATEVLLGERIARDVEVLNSRTLVFRAPATDEAGPVSLTAFNSNGFGAQSDAFTYQPVLVLSKLSPAIGHANGGTTITVTGSGFQDTNPGPLDLRFGGQELDFEVQSDTSLTFIAPRGEPWTPAGLFLRSRNGDAELKDAFTYVLPGLLAASSIDGSLLHVEPETGSTTVIRNSNIQARTTSMVMSKDGDIYAAHSAHSGQPQNHLARISLTSDTEEVLEDTTFNSRFGGMDMSADGKLLVISRNVAEGLLFMDLDTEKFTAAIPLPLGATNNCRGCSVAVDGNGRIFAALAQSGGDLSVVVGNAFEPAVPLQSVVNDNIRALTFAGAILYGVRRGSGGGFSPGSSLNSTLISIDVETGQITDIAGLPGRIDGLTNIPLPASN